MSEVARPPHAPHLGRIRKLLGPLHVTGVFWYRFHLFGVRTLPAWGVGIFITLFTTFFFFALRRIRRAIAGNLVPVLGPCGWWRRQVRIYRTMWSFAWCLSERYEHLATERRVRTELQGGEIWGRLTDSPEGLVAVTAHLGNWEAGSLVPAARDGRRVHVVREREMDPAAQQFIEGLLRRRGGAHYRTHFAEHDAGLGVDLLWALRAGDIVALQGDRPASGGRTLQVRLFDRPISFPAGPAALARASGVPLVPVFILREGRLRYRVVVRPPIRVPWEGDRGQALRAAAERIAADVQWAIAEKPYQWFCFAELWPAPGAGEAPA